MNHNDCKYIVTNIESVEGAIVISNNGLPLAWYTEKDNPIDQIASLSASLVRTAAELYLFDITSNASMVFTTSFGALNIRTLSPSALLVLCLAKGFSFLTINRILDTLPHTAP
jgi:predicted regulator of Ras-like GTPase activity (Roadblock/LC7/MglB family)